MTAHILVVNFAQPRSPWRVQAQKALSCTMQCCGGYSCVAIFCTRAYTCMIHIHACLCLETMSIEGLAMFRNAVML